MLDVRSLQFNLSHGAFSWVWEDQEELKQMNTIYENDIDLSETEKKNYGQEAVDLVGKREAFLNMINGLTLDKTNELLNYLLNTKVTYLS